eukprot:COSAG02_NODE_1774_length_10973_cov_18.317914_6_plen_142_part_00
MYCGTTTSSIVDLIYAMILHTIHSTVVVSTGVNGQTDQVQWNETGSDETKSTRLPQLVLHSVPSQNHLRQTSRLCLISAIRSTVLRPNNCTHSTLREQNRPCAIPPNSKCISSAYLTVPYCSDDSVVHAAPPLSQGAHPYS